MSANNGKKCLHVLVKCSVITDLHKEHPIPICTTVKCEKLLTGCSYAVISAACTPHYLHQWSQFNKAEKTCTQAWTWETQLKHAAFFHYLHRNQDDIRSGFTSITEHEKKENRLELTPFFNFLQGLWVWSNLAVFCLTWQFKACFLWMRHKQISRPAHWLFYKFPPALVTTEHLSCWLPLTCPDWGSQSVELR